jgi:hypothetical protein
MHTLTISVPLSDAHRDAALAAVDPVGTAGHRAVLDDGDLIWHTPDGHELMFSVVTTTDGEVLRMMRRGDDGRTWTTIAQVPTTRGIPPAVAADLCGLLTAATHAHEETS